MKVKGKGKAVPLQAWTGPEGSRKLRFPDFVTTAQLAVFTPRKYSWYSDQMKVASWNFLGETEKKCEMPQDIRCSDRNSSVALLKHLYTVFSLING